MTSRAREAETLLLAMFAAVPLYFTFAVSPIALILFHTAMTGILVKVLLGKGPELVPARWMRWLAIAYVPFYVVDAVMLSRTIAASTHLVLFIAAYQPIESAHRSNQPQRVLTTALIFIASLATSTHLSIVPFVIIFAFFVFRQLMYVSHMETARAVGHEYRNTPSARAAGFYLAGAMLIGAFLFPLLPRIKNPLVRGMMGPLSGSATSLSETINLNQQRASPSDATIVARVWLDREDRPFFTPVRLRGMIYDRYDEGEWRQSLHGIRQLPSPDGVFSLAVPSGVERRAIVQMRAMRGKLFLPAGTYAVSGLDTLYEGPSRETYYTYDDGMLTLQVRLAYQPEPLQLARVRMSGYPISPAVQMLARTIVGEEQSPEGKAALIEQYMVRNFRYVANTVSAPPKSLERFLLFDRAGHCEYFAAGMVALLNAVDVPARIAGGFYGGQLNPLTGYYAIRRGDAHAWTEVWDGKAWRTFDSTPALLRPGAASGNPLRVYLEALTDSLTFFWDRYVLTFGLGDQIELFTDLVTGAGDSVRALGSWLQADSRRVLTREFATLLALIVAAGLTVTILRGRRRRAFDVLAAYLAARSIPIGPSTTVEEALGQLREQHPEAAQELAPLIALYEEEVFSGSRDPGRTRLLRRKLAELKT